MKKVLALIPERGGFKRILIKNIKLFNKRPLIEWSIKLELKSKLIGIKDIIIMMQALIIILQKMFLENYIHILY